MDSYKRISAEAITLFNEMYPNTPDHKLAIVYEHLSNALKIDYALERMLAKAKTDEHIACIVRLQQRRAVLTTLDWKRL